MESDNPPFLMLHPPKVSLLFIQKERKKGKKEKEKEKISSFLANTTRLVHLEGLL